MLKRIFIIASILLWGAVFYAAYNYFSTELTLKAIDKDNDRLYNISTNDYYIANFYINHGRLPNSLAEVAEAEKSNPDKENLVPLAIYDPETKKEYVYKIASEDSYQICTTFATDTVADKTLFDNYTVYIAQELDPYAKSVFHKSGFDCMELSMAGNPEVARAKDTAPSPPKNALTFQTPRGGDKVCLGKEYTLTWNGDPTTENVGIYLVPPANLKQPLSWLQDGYVISPGELISDGNPENKKLTGSFDWIVGMLEPNEGKSAPEPVRPGKGYTLGVVTTNEGFEHTYSSNYFEIINCNVATAL